MASKRKIRVGVLFGGRSAEHEVSLVSGASVMKALDKKKYDVVPIGITKDGRWIIGPRVLTLLKSGANIPENLRALLPPEPSSRGLVPITQNQKSKIKNQKVDVIFPVLHGPFGEDGTVQGLLELTGIPYVGAGVLGSSLGMDKISQKKIFLTAGIPTPKFAYITSADFRRTGSRFLKRVQHDVGWPCFVKPSNMGSSVGITKVKNIKQLGTAIKIAMKYDRRIIVEQGIRDALEIECAVLGNDNPRASVPGQIISSNEFYDYDAKYVDGQSKAKIPAPLPKLVAEKVREYAVTAFKALDLAGMARVDFLVTKHGNIYISEVNTIPGFTSISMYPKLWGATRLPYAKLLESLIELALERTEVKNKLSTSYQPKKQWHR